MGQKRKKRKGGRNRKGAQLFFLIQLARISCRFFELLNADITTWRWAMISSSPPKAEQPLERADLDVVLRLDPRQGRLPDAQTGGQFLLSQTRRLANLRKQHLRDNLLTVPSRVPVSAAAFSLRVL